MLSQNSWQASANSGGADKAAQDTADIEALRAAYWAVVTASAHSVFSKQVLGQNQQPVSEPILNAYQAAVAAFANSVFSAAGIPQEAGLPYISPQVQSISPQSQKIQQQATTMLDIPQAGSPMIPAAPVTPQSQPENLLFKLPAGETSQWVPEAVAPKRVSRPSRQLPKPIIRKKGEQPASAQQIANKATTPRSNPLPPLNENLYTEPVAMQPQPTINKKEMNQRVQQFLNEFQPAPAPIIPEQTPVHPAQQKTPALTEAETGVMLDMLHEEALIENLPEMQSGWVSRTLSRPKIVTGIIGICLLASTVYAGLGYWWLNATSLSHAAEPNSGIESSATPRNNESMFKNIETLQNETNIIIPNEQADMAETLLAQAGPAKSFTMAELKSDLTGPTGRPDPFSPLIQEGTSAFSPLEDPKKKKDVLMDVQYTGFVGDVNSKDKVAIIRVSDPASGAKTLIKKAGDSFYVDGERIVLNAIAKNNLSLRVSGASRSLSLNPYQEITTASAATGGGSVGTTPAPSTPSTGGGTYTPGSPTSGSSGSRNSNPTTPTLQEPDHM